MKLSCIRRQDVLHRDFPFITFLDVPEGLRKGPLAPRGPPRCLGSMEGPSKKAPWPSVLLVLFTCFPPIGRYFLLYLPRTFSQRHSGAGRRKLGVRAPTASSSFPFSFPVFPFGEYFLSPPMMYYLFFLEHPLLGPPFEMDVRRA